MSLRLEEQKKYILGMLSSEEKEFIKTVIDFNKFKLNRLILNLDTFIVKNDPVVYVHTGDKNVNYDNIDSNIKTIYDESINEGIKIHYKGILSDYSL